MKKSPYSYTLLPATLLYTADYSII